MSADESRSGSAISPAGISVHRAARALREIFHLIEPDRRFDSGIGEHNCSVGSTS
jgi:hypothetical protein